MMMIRGAQKGRDRAALRETDFCSTVRTQTHGYIRRVWAFGCGDADIHAAPRLLFVQRRGGEERVWNAGTRMKFRSVIRCREGGGEVFGNGSLVNFNILVLCVCLNMNVCRAEPLTFEVTKVTVPS